MTAPCSTARLLSATAADIIVDLEAQLVAVAREAEAYRRQAEVALDMIAALDIMRPDQLRRDLASERCRRLIAQFREARISGRTVAA